MQDFPEIDEKDFGELLETQANEALAGRNQVTSDCKGDDRADAAKENFNIKGRREALGNTDEIPVDGFVYLLVQSISWPCASSFNSTCRNES